MVEPERAHRWPGGSRLVPRRSTNLPPGCMRMEANGENRALVPGPSYLCVASTIEGPGLVVWCAQSATSLRDVLVGSKAQSISRDCGMVGN